MTRDDADTTQKSDPTANKQNSTRRSGYATVIKAEWTDDDDDDE